VCLFALTLTCRFCSVAVAALILRCKTTNGIGIYEKHVKHDAEEVDVRAISGFPPTPHAVFIFSLTARV
jgi:hypothetical protein